MVGGSAWNHWDEQYKKTPYGNYELDENGEQIENPDYDPEVEYVPREDRDEWQIVGLLGQIPINKDQVIPDTWQFMWDIDDNVAMYYVK